MFEVTMKVDMAKLEEKFAAAAKQVKFAAAMALTQTAKDVQDALKAGMVSSFAYVTPYTRGSLFVSPATRDKLMAKVGIKGADTGIGAVKWLRPEIRGGHRQRGLEVILARAGLPPSGMYAVPGKFAKMRGPRIDINWVAQLVAAVAAQGNTGQSNLKGKGRNARKGQAAQYFVLTTKYGKLLPGIYGVKARQVYPYVLFVKQPTYRKRFDFFGIAESNARSQFPARFDAALQRAKATAR